MVRWGFFLILLESSDHLCVWTNNDDECMDIYINSKIIE